MYHIHAKSPTRVCPWRKILQQRLASFPGLRTRLDGDKPGVSVFTTGQPDVVVRGTGGLGIVIVKQIIPIFMRPFITTVEL